MHESPEKEINFMSDAQFDEPIKNGHEKREEYCF
jgi:hypothetical protein